MGRRSLDDVVVCSFCRYTHEKGCVATTGDISVSVSTAFLPELSSVHPPHFFFTYRIRYGATSDLLPGPCGALTVEPVCLQDRDVPQRVS